MMQQNVKYFLSFKTVLLSQSPSSEMKITGNLNNPLGAYLEVRAYSSKYGSWVGAYLIIWDMQFQISYRRENR